MKISFLGSGKVGAAVAYTAALQGLAREIVMVDAFADKARGEALDILQAQAFSPQARVRQGNIADTAGSDILVVTAGIPRKADEPRVLLLGRNAALIADLVRQAVAVSPGCILFVITNPLDVMTQLAYKVSGLPASRVIGMGTVLDTARYRSYIAAAFGVDARDLDAYVVGEHGETMVPLTSGISVRGVPLTAMAGYSRDKLDTIVADVIRASGEVIALKGGTVFAPAASAGAVLDAIVSDSRAVLPVCTYNDRYRLAVSLPTVVGRAGAGQVFDAIISAADREKFAVSIDNIRKYVAELDSVCPV
jgi:malate/lactate dehydrogenase